MEAFEKLKEKINAIEEKIGYFFSDHSLLVLAFVHSSFTNENPLNPLQHNERLEFLGDVVLGLLVSDFLYYHLPQASEGRLSYLRTRLIDASACFYYLQKLDLTDYFLLGKGESMNAGKGRMTVGADFFEALIGAIYLDGGIDAASDFFYSHFRDDMLAILDRPDRNWKAELQDYCQKQYQNLPDYKLIKAEGPDHLKKFHIKVTVGEIFLGEGMGFSKKEAEQKAAEQAMSQIP